MNRNEISTFFYLAARNEDFEQQDASPQIEIIEHPPTSVEQEVVESNAGAIGLAGLSIIFLLATLLLIL